MFTFPCLLPLPALRLPSPLAWPSRNAAVSRKQLYLAVLFKYSSQESHPLKEDRVCCARSAEGEQTTHMSDQGMGDHHAMQKIDIWEEKEEWWGKAGQSYPVTPSSQHSEVFLRTPKGSPAPPSSSSSLKSDWVPEKTSVMGWGMLTFGMKLGIYN